MHTTVTALYVVWWGLLELCFIHGMGKYGMDLCGCGQAHVASCCEYDNWLVGWLVSRSFGQLVLLNVMPCI